MQAYVSKNGTALRFSTCELSAKRLNVNLVLETPEDTLWEGEEIHLSLSTGQSLRFRVREEISKKRYYCELFYMADLEKEVSIGANPNERLSQIANRYLGEFLAGGLKGDYVVSNFAFRGSLWSLLGVIEQLLESRSYAQAQGIIFSATSTPLQIGSKLNSSFNTSDKFQAKLSHFCLLPCNYEGREVRKIIYDLTREIIWIWF